MTNTETDKLPLVETFTVGPGRWILPPAVRPDVGYSLQVFSPSGQYIGSVAPNGVHIRAKENDLVFRINLGRHEFKVSGTVKSQDRFEREFALVATFQIVDPMAFAIEYRQKTDPIAKLKSAITSQLMNWARQLDHDQLDERGVAHWAKFGATVPSSRIGVRVETIEQPTLALSAWHAEREKIVRDDVIRQDKHDVDLRINAENNEITKVNVIAASEVNEIKAESDNRIAAKGAFTAAAVQIYIERMHEAARDGIPLSQLRAQDPDFAAWHEQLAPARVSAAIAAPSFPPSGPMVDALRSDSLQSIGSEERYNALLGITCVLTELTEEQRLAAESQRITPIQQVFVIRSVDQGGVGANSNLAVGDIILQVAGTHLPSFEYISQLLRSVPIGQSPVIHICRGLEIYQATPEISF